jgi:hypothetical protein
MGYTLGFNSWQGPKIFLFFTASRPYLGPTQLPVQWYQGLFNGGILFCVNTNQGDADTSCFTLIADVTDETGICLRSEADIAYQH